MSRPVANPDATQPTAQGAAPGTASDVLIADNAPKRTHVTADLLHAAFAPVSYTHLTLPTILLV